MSPKDTIAQSLQRREDLKQRLDSKSALGEYMGMVYDVAGFLSVNAAVVRCLLEHLEQVSVSPEAFTCSELLVLLAKHSPQVLLLLLPLMRTFVDLTLMFHSCFLFQNNAQAFEGSVSETSAWLSACVSFEGAKSKQREAQGVLLEQCLAMVTTTCAAFETDPAQPALCSDIADHIKANAHPQICAKLAEVCTSPDILAAHI